MPATSTANRPAPSWSPEIDILLAGARTELTPAHRARLTASTSQTLDWRRLLSLAHAHRLVPLLHRHVTSGAIVLTDEAAAALQERAAANARRMLALSAELLQLLRLLAQHGIDTVPLKGPVLAQQLYRSIALRQAGDLDVLVREADLTRVEQLLVARGYHLEHRPSPELASVARRDLHHRCAVDARRGIRIELHYWLLRPRGRRTLDLEALVPRLRPFSFLGQQTSVLDDDDLLAYLCEHGAEHSWSRLEWIASVGELLRRGQTAAGAASFAAELGATRRVHAARQLATTLLDSDAGGEAPDRLSSAANRIVYRRLRDEPGRVTESSAERFSYLLLTDPTPAAAARRVGTMLLKPGIGDAEAVALPPALAPLHWAIRPLRLLVRYLRPHRHADGASSAR